MSYQADLINAYREQLASIREAWKDVKRLMDNSEWPCTIDSREEYALKAVEEAIEMTEADDLENMFISKDPPILLPGKSSKVTDATSRGVNGNLRD